MERLQKFLSRAGVASRRHAEEFIVEGRVKVNGKVVTVLGTQIEPQKDLVLLDGKLVSVNPERKYFLFYKPPGVVTTLSDPEGRPTVGDYAQETGGRVFPVGRLDYDAEGALLLTDDGELANKLMHPSHQVPRVYLAKVKGTPDDPSLQKLVDGVRLEDGMAHAIQARIFEKAQRNTWVKIIVTEGRQHLVKRLCAAIGHPVVRLYRPAHASLSVKGLRPGELRALTNDEIRRVKAVADGDQQPEPPLSLPARRHGHAAPGFEPEEDEDDARPEGKRAASENNEERHEPRRERPSTQAREAKPRSEREERPRFGAPDAAAAPGEAPAQPSGRGERPRFGEGGYQKRTEGAFGRKRSFGDRDGGARSERTEGALGEKRSGGERTEGAFGKKRSFGDRDAGARGGRTEGAFGKKRSFGDRDGGARSERPEGGFGQKRAFGDRGGRGERPAGGFGQKRSFGDRDGAGRSERPRFGGDRSERPSAEGERKRFSDRDRAASAGEAPARAAGRGERFGKGGFVKRTEGAFGKKRSFGDRDGGGGGASRPFPGEPGYGKPRGEGRSKREDGPRFGAEGGRDQGPRRFGGPGGKPGGGFKGPGRGSFKGRGGGRSSPRKPRGS